MWRLIFLCPSVLLITFAAFAQSDTHPLRGDWREPGGSVIRVEPCGDSLCATLIAISPTVPTRFDTENPDPAKQTRKLCGLVIGHNFHRTSPTHAEHGILYDPKTGKTYHGKMTVHGDRLALRGYIGLSLFGRTETWRRTHVSSPCATP